MLFGGRLILKRSSKQPEVSDLQAASDDREFDARSSPMMFGIACSE